MKNKISAGIAITFLLVTVAAFAANFTDDTLQIGKPGSSADKSVVFGASNKKKLSHKPSTQTLDYEGNNLSVGDGLNTSDKTLKLNKGVNSPTLRHNFTSGDLEIENAPVLNQKGNTVSVGDGTNTNKVLKFNKGASSPEIRYNSTTGKLQFTNDTTTYKDIGSGSGGGGGTNLLQEFNSDFEAGSPPQNWTASGGTFITETTDPLFGLQSGSWDSSASSQTLSSQLVTIEKGFIGKKCTADIEYKWPSGVSGDLSFQVVDQVPNILATVALDPTTGSNTRKAFLAFDCPTVATDQLRVRLLSNVSNPALIVVDNAFVGVNKSTTNVSQAVFAGESYWNSTASCLWSRSSATIGPVGTSATCPGPTIVDSTIGNWQTTDTDLPRQTITNLPAGKYRATFWTQMSASANVATGLAINDGTTTCEAVSGEHSSSSSSGVTVSCVFTYLTPQASRTFELYVGVAAGNTVNLANLNTSPKYSMKFQLEKFPVNDSEAINLETTGWFVDAILTATSSPSLGTSTTASSLVADNDITLSLNDGSASAKVACSGAVATGTTCSGNEEVGIEFDIPYAGNYLVCSQATAGSGVGGSAGSSITQTFWFQERTTSGASVIREGKKKQSRAHSYEGSSNSQFVYSNIGMCEIWPFASAGPKRISVAYGQNVAGGSVITSNELTMDTAISGRNFSLSVYPLTQNFPAPVFTEVKNKLNAGEANIKEITARIENSSGTPSILKQYGGGIASLTDVGTGHTRVNFTPSFWSEFPICFTEMPDLGINAECRLQGDATTTQVDVFCINTTPSVVDVDFNIKCTGK